MAVDEDMADEAGCHGYITKFVNKNILLKILICLSDADLIIVNRNRKN